MLNNNSLFKRICVCVVAAAAAMSVTMSGCNLQNEGETKKENSKVSADSENTQSGDVKSKFGDDIAVKSDNYNISLPIMMYLFNYNYQNYVNYYGQYMSYYGFDASKDLKEQYYNQESSQTWYDYFLEMTKQYIEQTLVMAEGAKAEGVVLDDNDLKSVETAMSSLESTAASNGKTAEQYISEYYGKGVTKDDINECLKLTALAQKYYNKIYDGYKYNDNDYEKFYEENKTKYQYADFLSFSFKFESTSSQASGSSETSVVSVNEEEKQKAKAYAEDLAKCKNRKEFEDYITKYLKANPDLVETDTQQSSSDNSESSMSDEQFNQAVKAQVEAALSQKYGYEVTSEAGKWIFENNRKENETKIIESTDAYVVIMMVKPAYRDEAVNKNVRHILFTADTYGSDDKAKAKAEEVYKEWKDGKATEESFGELAKKYSTDTGSTSNGGLYENVTEGQMVTEFNDWTFDKSRKPGDTGIVKTSYGYHIMYFVGDSDPAWKVAVDTQMRTDSYETDYQKLKEKYKVQFDDDYLKTIEVFSSESSAQSSTAASNSTAESSSSEKSDSKAESSSSEKSSSKSSS